MARKKIKKFSVAELPPATGSISDTLNVEDKIKNAPSINLVEQMTGIPQEGVIAFDGDEIPEGYEEVDNVLWTNPNPTAEFSGQTINLKDNNYEYFRIEFHNTSTERIHVYDAKVNTSFQPILTGVYTPAGKGYLALYYRGDCSCTQKTITFSDCKGIMTNSTDILERNSYLIPTKVIGYNL